MLGLGLWNDNASNHEAARGAEGSSGGFDVLRLRFTIVDDSLGLVRSSPTIATAIENVRRAEAAAERLQYNQKIEALEKAAEAEAATSTPVTVAQSAEEMNQIPTLAESDEAARQTDMVARARQDVTIHAVSNTTNLQRANA